MRFIIMHKTNAHWESGAAPGPELIAQVGALIGELARAGRLLGAEGLRASSQGVRLGFHAGARTVTKGPFEGNNALPAGFTIVRARSMDDAIEWATREAMACGDVEIDIRPVTEPWDIGMRPAPADAATRRYMVLRKATAATEAGVEPSSSPAATSGQPIDENTTVHAVVSERMRPSSRGRRYKNSINGVTMIDGPFAESKELIGGYVIVSAESLDDAGRVAAHTSRLSTPARWACANSPDRNRRPAWPQACRCMRAIGRLRRFVRNFHRGHGRNRVPWRAPWNAELVRVRTTPAIIISPWSRSSEQLLPSLAILFATDVFVGLG